jgi:hypothetical protein
LRIMDLSQRITPALPRKLSAPFRWHTTACEKVPSLSLKVRREAAPMKRLAMILAATWLAAVPATAKAGELDAEYGTNAKVSTPEPAFEKTPSELDAETPTQACGHHRWRRAYFGFGGYGYNRGYFGYSGFGFGYGRGFGSGWRRW